MNMCSSASSPPSSMLSAWVRPLPMLRLLLLSQLKKKSHKKYRPFVLCDTAVSTSTSSWVASVSFFLLLLLLLLLDPLSRLSSFNVSSVVYRRTPCFIELHTRYNFGRIVVSAANATSWMWLVLQLLLLLLPLYRRKAIVNLVQEIVRQQQGSQTLRRNCTSEKKRFLAIVDAGFFSSRTQAISLSERNDATQLLS